MYNKILVAIDLGDSSEQIINRAKELASKFGAKIHLLHVIEYMPIEPMGDALLPAMDIEKDMVERAERNLEDIAKKHQLSDAPRTVEVGSTKGEIVRIAEEHSCGLVVLGARERHGLSILVNDTEDTVLHKAKCDVLAVRIP
ncbi:MAG: universal stress protein [Woeseia sp.]|nr:universal stress protein [Woeseia sp.]MBT8095725.1 universal stress protein [Woeseia sp.]NNE62420.1 universal stress protein [Woeseia sp.]NNL55361.1 universal stress protein [Woeseia sp.]